MQRSKALSYIGFAIKSGSLRSGVNAIATLKKADLLIVCKSASQNTQVDAEKLAKRLGCPLMESAVSVEEITGKPNCKLIAVTDGNLAKAVLESSDENFTIKFGGCKK